MSPLAACQKWVDDVVIGLNLCPFAASPRGAGRVRFALSRAADVAELIAEVSDEIDKLAEDPAVDTTLLVVPELTPGFDDILDLVAAAEAWLEATGRDAGFQLVAFHPDFQFEGAAADDPANGTNRSPHPMVHILRAEDVRRAAAAHPDVHGIPDRNATLLRARAATEG